MAKSKTDQEVLENVLAECLRLRHHGFAKVARSEAIRRKVPEGRRLRKTGDWDRWWGRLDEALRLALKVPPQAQAASPRPPATLAEIQRGRSCLPVGDRD